MEVHRYKSRRLLAAIIFVSGLLGIIAGTARAEDAKNKLGNWLGVNSTVRFSDRWSLFGQGEVRFWEVASDLNETLFRIAGHYDINQIALVGRGHVRVDTWPFNDGGDRLREENRLYQQFALKQAWARAKFEHRFRLEQRWFPKNDGDSHSNRARYRLQVTAVKPCDHAARCLRHQFLQRDLHQLRRRRARFRSEPAALLYAHEPAKALAFQQHRGVLKSDTWLKGTLSFPVLPGGNF